MSLASLAILPKKFWATHKLSEPLTEVPLGSGAYTVKDYKMGQYLVYERLKDYWGMDLPVNKGQLNFDFLRYDYYKDEVVSFEAFKAGQYDFYPRASPSSGPRGTRGRTSTTARSSRRRCPTRGRRECRRWFSTPSGPCSKTARVRQALGTRWISSG